VRLCVATGMAEVGAWGADRGIPVATGWSVASGPQHVPGEHRVALSTPAIRRPKGGARSMSGRGYRSWTPGGPMELAGSGRAAAAHDLPHTLGHSRSDTALHRLMKPIVLGSLAVRDGRV